MASYTQTITADGTYKLGNVFRGDASYYIATVYASGTWGSGTINWKWSPDGGNTLFALKDASNNALSSTANDSYNIALGNATPAQTSPAVYAVLSGSTSPSLTVGLLDNR
jgi:hypothetical protein